MSDPSFSPVSVIGMGARTPVGLTAAHTAAAVRAGISRLGEHPYMIDRAGLPYIVAMDRTLGVHTRHERLLALVCSAIDEAMSQVGTNRDLELPVYLALPEKGNFFTRRDVDQLAHAVTFRYRERWKTTVYPIPKGNAGSLLGLWRAAGLIASGASRMCIVAGVDSHLDSDHLEALDRAGRITSTSNRWGYPPGEAAGALLISDRHLAREMNRPQLMDVRGVGIATEFNRIATDSVCTGNGLSDAMLIALRASGAPSALINAIYCDINGERYRNSEYVYAVLRAPPGAIPSPSNFTTAVDCWGDVGAATCPLLICLAAASAQRGYSSGLRTMIWASSESGLRGAAIIELPTGVKQ